MFNKNDWHATSKSLTLIIMGLEVEDIFTFTGYSLTEKSGQYLCWDDTDGSLSPLIMFVCLFISETIKDLWVFNIIL